MNEVKKAVIHVDHIYKDYGASRGNFDLSLNLYQGETLGIVGENGAGKSTLLRQIMGFIKPDSGRIQIYDKDAYNDSANTKMYIGYIPGEINFPDVKSGSEFLKNFGKSRYASKENFDYANELIQRMQLDVRAYPKRMSKGMKQKTAIVAAMMLKSPILLMDEPTTGLDPLMRDQFLQIVEEQKARKASIIMTSNTIEELERVCDRVALLSHGQIVNIASMKKINNRYFRDYKIEFNTEEDYLNFLKGRDDIKKVQPQYNQVTIRIAKEDVPELLGQLSLMNVKFIAEVKYTLSEYFSEIRKEAKDNAY